MVPLGHREKEKWQHRGYGEELLAEAERIAREEYDKTKLLVISGIGARNYYRKFGYEREGPYMQFSTRRPLKTLETTRKWITTSADSVVTQWKTKPQKNVQSAELQNPSSSRWTESPLKVRD